MRRLPLNNLKLKAARCTPEYQAVLIDLAKAGLLDKAKVEKLLGYPIPDCWKDSEFAKD